jgi:hypothetical protein
LGGGHHLLGDRLEQGSEEPLLVGGGVQVDRVIPGQEVLQVQVVTVGRPCDAFVAVDGQDLLGRGIQRVTARSVRYWLDSQASSAAGTPAVSRRSLICWSSRLSSQCSTSAMDRPLVAAANSMGARNLVPMVFQNRCSGRCSSVGVCSIALASITAICWAPAQVEQEASGLHLAAVTPEAPRGSMTRTWPTRVRWARVARSKSGLTEVATRGPDHSRTSGMTRAEVL